VTNHAIDSEFGIADLKLLDLTSFKIEVLRLWIAWVFSSSDV
jgi:hypothetical protein